MSATSNKALIGALIAGAALIPLTRLPQFLGGHLVPDGDECILGVMAKHTLEGKCFPVFLYGQSYGLSTLEVGVAAVCFRLFGASAAALKGGMLLIWAAGWVFLVLAVRRFADARAALIAAILMVVCPAWGPWSMKAWGGYVTAFLLTNICLWLMAGAYPQGRWTTMNGLAVGVLMGLIYLAKPLWLLGLAPFIAAFVARRRRMAEAAILALATMTTVLAVQWLGRTGEPDFWSPPLFRHPDILRAMRLLPYRLWVHLSGSYLMEHRYPAGLFTEISATVWFACVVAVVTLQVRRFRSGERFTVGQASAVGVLLILAFTLPVNHILFGFRYMLPLTGFLVISMAAELSRLWSAARGRRAVAAGLVGILVVSGVLALGELGRVSFSGSSVHGATSESQALDALIKDLIAHEVHAVYSVDPMLHWVLIFASNERIAARWVSSSERYSRYPRDVDRALMKGKGVAIVGRVEPAGRYSVDLKTFMEELKKAGYRSLRPRVINDMFYVLADPSVHLIKRLRFGELRFAIDPQAGGYGGLEK